MTSDYPPARGTLRATPRDCRHGGRHRHGTPAAYTHDRCGCPACRAAKSKQNQDWMKRRYLTQARQTVDATGTRRRVEALAAIGWPIQTQSKMLGKSRDYLSVLRRRNTRVHVRTARAVAALYDQLSMTLPPPSGAASHAGAHARRAGWPPPLAWDNIDDPTEQPALGIESRGAAARRSARVEDYLWLRSQGETDEQIATRWGLSIDTFARWWWRNRQALAEEAAA